MTDVKWLPAVEVLLLVALAGCRTQSSDPRVQATLEAARAFGGKAHARGLERVRCLPWAGETAWELQSRTAVFVVAGEPPEVCLYFERRESAQEPEAALPPDQAARIAQEFLQQRGVDIGPEMEFAKDEDPPVAERSSVRVVRWNAGAGESGGFVEVGVLTGERRGVELARWEPGAAGGKCPFATATEAHRIAADAIPDHPGLRFCAVADRGLVLWQVGSGPRRLCRVVDVLSDRPLTPAPVGHGLSRVIVDVLNGEVVMLAQASGE